jgi:peroxiredoxin
LPVQAGERLPDGEFTVMTDTGPGRLSTEELFSGKRVVLVSVPGAFTPTCSARHLPGFLERADDILACGVDTIAFTAVNDVHVMNAWGKDQGVGDKIEMLADGSAYYVSALGLDIDSSAFGMGKRGQRFVIIANDGIAEHVIVDKPGKFELTSADAVLDRLS